MRRDAAMDTKLLLLLLLLLLLRFTLWQRRIASDAGGRKCRPG